MPITHPIHGAPLRVHPDRRTNGVHDANYMPRGAGRNRPGAGVPCRDSVRAEPQGRRLAAAGARECGPPIEAGSWMKPIASRRRWISAVLARPMRRRSNRLPRALRATLEDLGHQSWSRAVSGRQGRLGDVRRFRRLGCFGAGWFDDLGCFDGCFRHHRGPEVSVDTDPPITSRTAAAISSGISGSM